MVTLLRGGLLRSQSDATSFDPGIMMVVDLIRDELVIPTQGSNAKIPEIKLIPGYGVCDSDLGLSQPSGSRGHSHSLVSVLDLTAFHWMLARCWPTEGQSGFPWGCWSF